MPRTHLHVVKGNSDFLVEVRTEERDLGVALAEVVQHDELGVHAHPHADRLRGGAAGRVSVSRKPHPGAHTRAAQALPPAPPSPGNSLTRLTVGSGIVLIFSKTVPPPRTLPRELDRNKSRRSPHDPLVGSRLAEHHWWARSFPAGSLGGCSTVTGVGSGGRAPSILGYLCVFSMASSSRPSSSVASCIRRVASFPREQEEAVSGVLCRRSTWALGPHS